MLNQPLPVVDEVVYPYADGEPMAESGIHSRFMLEMMYLLDKHFRNRTDILIGSNQFLYYVEGDPKQVLAPDVYVTFGVEKRPRKTYKLWEVGRPPAVVIEVSSDTTAARDLGEKKGIYEYIGVQEYFVIDLLADYLDPPMRRFTLGEGGYTATRGRSLSSEALGLRFVWKGPNDVDLVDEASGQHVLRPLEEIAAREEAERYAAKAEAHAAKAEAHAAKAEAHAATAEAHATKEEARATKEAAHAAKEGARADEERRRRLALEEQVRALEARLRRAERDS